MSRRQIAHTNRGAGACGPRDGRVTLNYSQLQSLTKHGLFQPISLHGASKNGETESPMPFGSYRIWRRLGRNRFLHHLPQYEAIRHIQAFRQSSLRTSPPIQSPYTSMRLTTCEAELGSCHETFRPASNLDIVAAYFTQHSISPPSRKGRAPWRSLSATSCVSWDLSPGSGSP